MSQSTDSPESQMSQSSHEHSNSDSNHNSDEEDEGEDSYEGDLDEEMDYDEEEDSEDSESESNVSNLDDESEYSSDEGKDVWKMERRFDDKNDLEEFLKAENCWSYRGIYRSNKGKKTIYRCNKVTRKGPQCEAKLYTLHCIEQMNVEHSDDEQGGNIEQRDDIDIQNIEYYELYRCKSLHTHESLLNKSAKKVSDETKIKIIGMHKNKQAPVTISLSLRADRTIVEQPTLQQIKNIIAVYKNKEHGRNPLTMRQLTDFVNKHTAIPNDEDNAFVVLFERSPSEEKKKFFRYFISTVRLLKMAADAVNIHADSTHKITTEKLPLIVIGSTDVNKKFHFIGFTITSNETANDYEMSFKAVIQGVLQVTGKEFTPNALVCDGDAAIHNGWKKAFNQIDTMIIMCYAHVMSNIHRKYKFVDKKNRELVEADIRMLHKCPDERTFNYGCELFIEKWITTEKEVAQKIEKSFFIKNSNWYIGCCYRTPKTNNSLERFNGEIKQQQTLHKKKPLKIFKNISLTMVEERSRQYIMDKTPFEKELNVSTEMMQIGIEYKKDFKSRPLKLNGETDFFMFCSSINNKITLEDVEAFENAEYENFDEFTMKAFTIWKITFPFDSQKWKESVCTCPEFDNAYMCKHIITIACQIKAFDSTQFTVNYDDEPLFPVVRGRPKRATAPLVKD